MQAYFDPPDLNAGISTGSFEYGVYHLHGLINLHARETEGNRMNITAAFTAIYLHALPDVRREKKYRDEKGEMQRL